MYIVLRERERKKERKKERKISIRRVGKIKQDKKYTQRLAEANGHERDS